MTGPLKFGWRLPDFPENRLAHARDRAMAFRDEILSFLDIIHGHFDTAWAGDHFFPWPADMDQSLDTLESWTLITYLAAAFPKMSFCPSVLNQAYRSPALVAKMAATLQLLSGGRLILGIGAGWKENEQRAYGFDFPAPKWRLDQLEEAVQIIRKMWTEALADLQWEVLLHQGCLLFSSARPNSAVAYRRFWPQADAQNRRQVCRLVQPQWF